ncbi:MAG: prolyl-tRNA synthetase associated domain-containing protein [Ruminococcaceae bacterium]|nr:prolyl-tRNA synthetase associated domain-containing protein [Oscillospiraceae bacterium]
MTLQEGRPTNTQGRAQKELEAYDFLDALGVSYQRIDHAAANTMEVCAEIDAALGATICKNLFLCNRQCTDFYLLMMPGDKVFKTKDLSHQLGTARLSFGAPEKMEEYLHTLPGSASVLGLMHDGEQRVQLVIDREVLEGEFVGAHPLVNTSSIRIATRDLIERIIPAMGHDYRVVELVRYES